MDPKTLLVSCAVSAVLVGCGAVQRLASPLELPSTMNFSDPIDFYLENDYQLQKFTGRFDIAVKKTYKEKDFGREFEIRGDEYGLVPTRYRVKFNLDADMKTICSDLGGEMRKNGWCAHKETLLPLFYYYFKTISEKPSVKTLDGFTYNIFYDSHLYAPKTMDDYKNPVWVNFAYGKGFETPAAWRKKLREAEIAKAREAKQKVQEEEERRRIQAAMEAQERKDRIARERAWQQRLEYERPIKLSKKGIPVCRKTGGNDYPRYFGFTEGHDENRIQVRVNELQTSPGWMDANFKPQVIWSHVDDWFICN